jgi:tagaturonate reductase
MKLSKQTLSSISKRNGLDLPGASIFSLPEKVLQFGTGVLLRGLPDYFIDKANKAGLFNGRIVVVKSTSKGDTGAWAAQDYLSTQCVRGVDNGTEVNEFIVNAAVSRVLTASEDWDAILGCAANPNLQIIISNTTEVGITLVDNDPLDAHPPSSFPAKLLALLLKRYQLFKGTAESGMVIIPTELISNNGGLLKKIVLTLAEQHKLDKGFIEWLEQHNEFCNSLVDRIVPGALSSHDKLITEKALGYEDECMIMSEVYRLWAIETNKTRTKEILSFAAADKGVILTDNIERYKELKLRLLNGSHTFTCALAIDLGFSTVKEAMANSVFNQFITELMMEEIVPAITGDTVSTEEARAFAGQVLDRYRNPFIEHQWVSISLQYSSKMNMRNMPVIKRYIDKKGQAPQRMALGFAAYLWFMKSEKEGNGFKGYTGGKSYTINDDKAAVLNELWKIDKTDTFVQTVLEQSDLWGGAAGNLPGFAAAVTTALQAIKDGTLATVMQAVAAPQTH